VLIEPELLEEMAADENTKEKYLNIIDSATSQLEEATEQLGDAADDVKSIGFSVGRDGSVNFFADLEKMSENQKERIEKQCEEKAEKAEEAEKKEKKEQTAAASKKAFAKADTIEELIEKIKNVDWDSIKETQDDVQGSRFDCRA